ncbi:MAG: flagellar basal body-associated FliL family protein [Deltaproteobacteria bacterium]|nr:flagellar basal body-associated FliL family protein [Deltaproteobacteria bacterium]
MTKTNADAAQVNPTSPQGESSPAGRAVKNSPGELSKDVPKKEESKNKFGKKILLMLGVASVLFIGGGVWMAAYQGWISIPGLSQGKKPEPAKVALQAIGPMIKLSPLVVNLNEEKSHHFIKTTIVLEIGRQEWVEDVQNRMPSLTDMVILTLCDKRLEDLRLGDSKDNLKKELLTKAAQVMGSAKIKQIYFEEFLFQ